MIKIESIHFLRAKTALKYDSRMSRCEKNPTPFSAIDASLKYLYQVRSALLWALRRLKTESEFFVRVETLDDVAFETTDGGPTDLLQKKHHRIGA